MNELALFSGAGGGILGGHLLWWRTVAAVEIEDYPRRVLLQRQADGLLPRFPIWDDICTFDGRPWRGKIDVITGGFPCQDISAAGKGAGIEGEKSGLWSEMARIVGEVLPRYVFVENSPMLTLRGLDRVLGDLSTLGYNARWGVVGGVHTGAPHKRERIWIVAHDSNLLQYAGGDPQQEIQLRTITSTVTTSERCWWKAVPEVGRVAHGVANRMDRARAIGNGQIPGVAATAWKILTEQL
jgi:DNA (cytosine-5)-methyltransferase 1